ncbi:hypothetical protein DRQ29_06005 [bacterium]|nr:MAG: hypothetical protein DRQ29_06005 [bacterium]
MKHFLITIIISSFCFIWGQSVQSPEKSQGETDTISETHFAPKPTVAALLSTAIPGAGQIYDRDFWHAPIFILAESYCLWRAYDFNSQADSLWNLRNSLDPESSQYSQTGTEFDHSTANRNTYLWIFAGVKFLDIVDAYVGAHLFKFQDKMNPPLSLSFVPTENSVELTFTIRF